LQRYKTSGEKDNEQYYRATILNGTWNEEDVLLQRIQRSQQVGHFSLNVYSSGATLFYSDHLLSAKNIAASVWNRLRESVLFTCLTVRGQLTRRKKLIYPCTHQTEKYRVSKSTE